MSRHAFRASLFAALHLMGLASCPLLMGRTPVASEHPVGECAGCGCLPEGKDLNGWLRMASEYTKPFQV